MIPKVSINARFYKVVYTLMLQDVVLPILSDVSQSRKTPSFFTGKPTAFLALLIVISQTKIPKVSVNGIFYVVY